MATERPLVVVVGQTGSGKSELALEIAERFGGEIICADSRTIYRAMDIGTAKPGKIERRAVPHWGLDLADPGELFTVADFKAYAEAKIREIRGRGHLPILVGGTGLYIDALLFNFSFRKRDLENDYDNLSISELHELIAERDLELPNNSRNPRHLVRVLQAAGETDKREPIRQDAILVGLKLSTDELAERIEERVETMLQNGLEDEVRKLVEQFGWDSEAMSGIGYREFRPFFSGEADIETVKEEIVRHTRQFAKRQRTWFKRNPHIKWFDSPGLAIAYVQARMK